MRLHLIRLSDGKFFGQELTNGVYTVEPTTNPMRGACWRRESEADTACKRFYNARVVPFDLENGVMTEAVSAKRAQEIWNARSPMGDWRKGLYTTAEDAYIRKVWDKMDGGRSWSDALLAIAKGKDA